MLNMSAFVIVMVVLFLPPLNSVIVPHIIYEKLFCSVKICDRPITGVQV